MMNILALSLVLSSLAAAGIWSPTPRREDVDVRLKGGERVSVVGYDEGGKRNTEVSTASQPPPQKQPKSAGYFCNKEAMKEAASVLPNLGQGISPGGKAGHGSHFPGELICDAFGKCTETISNVFGKAKDKVSETADETKRVVGVALGKAKEAAVQKGQDLKQSAEDSIDKVKDTVGTEKDTAKMEKAREIAGEVAKEAREKTTRVANSTANKLFEGAKYMEALKPVMAIANLMGLALAYGMGLWVTFISSNLLAEMLPRQQFGMVQSKIYPVYFKAMGFSIGLALLGHILGQRKALFSSSKPEMFQAFNLLSSFVLVLVNGLYLEPKATKVMLERMKMEKEQGSGRDSFVIEESRGSEVAMKSRGSQTQSLAATIARLNERLKKLNAKSSILNVVTLMALTWHLLYLAQRLSFNSC